jgi:hypothetical protein
VEDVLAVRQMAEADHYDHSRQPIDSGSAGSIATMVRWGRAAQRRGWRIDLMGLLKVRLLGFWPQASLFRGDNAWGFRFTHWGGEWMEV